MNEAEVQAKLERIELLIAKLIELFNIDQATGEWKLRVAAIADEVSALLQSITELLEATQEPKQSESKEGTRQWYRFDLISVETMSMSDFCKHTVFLEECNRLKVSPKFESMLVSAKPSRFMTTSVCILKDVTVSEDWLTQHSVDGRKMIYYVGDLTFYAGTRFTYLGEH